jgi:hypothetical protein
MSESPRVFFFRTPPEFTQRLIKRLLKLGLIVVDQPRRHYIVTENKIRREAYPFDVVEVHAYNGINLKTLIEKIEDVAVLSNENGTKISLSTPGLNDAV